jgi:hypothetical protein
MSLRQFRQSVVQSLLSSKLGRCPKCIRWSLTGTAVSWVVELSFLWLQFQPVLSRLGFVVAVSFTALLIGHLITFTIRVASQPVVASSILSTGLPSQQSRRIAMLRIGWAALSSTVWGYAVFRSPKDAYAQNASSCENPHWKNSGAAIGPVTVCGKNNHVAEEAAQIALQSAATAVANAICNPLSTQACPFCVAGREQLAITCISLGTACSGGTLFTCNAVVTKVNCRCGTS